MFKIVNNFNKKQIDFLFNHLNIGTYKIDKKIMYYSINGVNFTINKVNRKTDIQMHNIIMSKYLSQYSVVGKYKYLIIPIERLDNQIRAELAEVANELISSAEELYMNILYLSNTIPEISQIFKISKKTVRLIRTVNRRKILVHIFKKEEETC